MVGAENGLFSFVHIDDAAAATMIALHAQAPAIYNIVDNEPAAVGDWLPVYAELLGAHARFGYRHSWAGCAQVHTESTC